MNSPGQGDWRMDTTPWPGNTVRYRWARDINGGAKTAALTAMEHWERKTCVKFKLVSYGKDVVTISSDKKGCYAHVGYIGVPQVRSMM